MEIEQLLDILRNYGLPIRNSNESIVIYAICVFVLSNLMLLCFVNVLIYFSVLLGYESLHVQNKETKKFKVLMIIK